MSIEHQPEFVDLGHTEQLYQACNELILRTAAINLTGITGVYGHDEEVSENMIAEAIEQHCKELPHSSQTHSQSRVFAAKFATKPKKQRVQRSVHIGLSAIELDIDRTRVLQGPLLPTLGTYALRSSLRYTCGGAESLIVRNDAELVSPYLSDREKGLDYARLNDELLYSELKPYWDEGTVNMDATRSGRFENMEVRIPEEHAVTVAEFTGLMSLIDSLGRR